MCLAWSTYTINSKCILLLTPPTTDTHKWVSDSFPPPRALYPLIELTFKSQPRARNSLKCSDLATELFVVPPTTLRLQFTLARFCWCHSLSLTYPSHRCSPCSQTSIELLDPSSVLTSILNLPSEIEIILFCLYQRWTPRVRTTFSSFLYFLSSAAQGTV